VAIDELINAIRDEATGQAVAIRTRAAEEISRITAAIDAVRLQEREDTLARQKRTWDQEHERAIIEVRRRTRRRTLTARDVLLERVFRRAEEQFPGVLSTTAYLTTLPQRVGEALAFTDGRPVTLRCSRTIVSAVTDVVRGDGNVAVIEDDAIGSGFAAVTNDGALTVDASLESTLRRRKPVLAIEVMQLLPPAESSDVG
jgi:vacuolar-type H+-ATPase subunit E/Vma4